MMVWWSTALQGLSVSTLGPWVILFGEAGNFELRYAFVGGSREAGLLGLQPDQLPEQALCSLPAAMM